jgi:glycosyltransferase involved in cell wall biosynthesis
LSAVSRERLYAAEQQVDVSGAVGQFELRLKDLGEGSIFIDSPIFELANERVDAMSTAFPRVSVVMSVYNGLPLVREAVQSIQSQTFEDFEFIIVNDGSTDGTLAYLKSVEAMDSRVRILDQANTGLTRALIRGVAEARSSLIARMDADDLSAPDRLRKQVAVLDEMPDLCAATCGIEYVTEQLERVIVNDGRHDMDAIPMLNTLFNSIGGHGHMMFRKSAYELAGGYDPDFRYAQDYDLWTRMLCYGRLGVARGILYRFRLGDNSISKKFSGQQMESAALVANREFQKLTGTFLDKRDSLVILQLWSPREGPEACIRDLAQANRSMRKAFSSYFEKFPERRHCMESVRMQIAEMWLRKTSLRRPIRFLFVAGFSMSWSPRTAIQGLRRRLLRQLAPTTKRRAGAPVSNHDVRSPTGSGKERAKEHDDDGQHHAPVAASDGAGPFSLRQPSDPPQDRI